QSVLYVVDSVADMDDESKRRVLIDPNDLSKDGTMALASWVPSDDGKLLAYAIADGGSDWRTWYVRDVETGKDLDDKIQWSKFSSAAWMPDNSGFYYSAYDAPADGEELTGTNLNQKLYFHRVGTSQAEDQLIYTRPDHPKWGFGGSVTDDGRYLIIGNWKGTDPETQVFIKDLRQEDSPVLPLITGFDAEYAVLGSDGDTLFVFTDLDAPRKRVLAVDAASATAAETDGDSAGQTPATDPGGKARQGWATRIAQTEDTLRGVSHFGDRFIANYLRDARSAIVQYDSAGKKVKDVQLPGVGTVGGFGGRDDAKETFYTFTNYTTPPAIYRVDLFNSGDTLKQELLLRPEVPLDTRSFETRQVFYKSKDGTRVPMILTYKKGTQLDGSNKTLLYAYGGFNISITPGFSPAVARWIDAGNVYAVANLRGGGEYGSAWHEAGMLDRKQNVFDDFIAAAEYLIDEKWTSKEHLGVRGGSNGGLLVGAVMTQRPDLFGACLPAVGV
ncbi:MAG: prolyl oligopeptidase family serine peptidase, partial [Planctomycetota bacterium]